MSYIFDFEWDFLCCGYICRSHTCRIWYSRCSHPLPLFLWFLMGLSTYSVRMVAIEFWFFLVYPAFVFFFHFLRIVNMTSYVPDEYGRYCSRIPYCLFCKCVVVFPLIEFFIGIHTYWVQIDSLAPWFYFICPVFFDSVLSFFFAIFNGILTNPLQDTCTYSLVLFCMSWVLISYCLSFSEICNEISYVPDEGGHYRTLIL